MSAWRERLGLLRDRRGFTMVEMMVVLIIIAVLIGVGIKFYLGYIEGSKITKAKGQISTMQAALDSYFAENGKYPTQWGDAGIDTSAKDPWGQSYRYDVGDNETSYTLKTGYDKIQGDKVLKGTGAYGKSEPPTLVESQQQGQQ
jgi:general secretion pathway protein G